MKYLGTLKLSYSAVAYTGDGRYIVSLNSRRFLRFWDLSTFELALTVTLPDFPRTWRYPPVTTLAILDRRAVLAEAVWDIGPALDWLARPSEDKPACPRVMLQDAPQRGHVLPLHRRGQVMMTGPVNTDGGIWNLDGTCVRSLRLPTVVYHYHPPVVSPDGGFLAVLNYKTVSLYEVGTGNALAKLPHTDAVGFACFAPDGKRLATATTRNVWLWDVENHEQLARFPAFGKGIHCLAYHPNGRQVAAADRAGEVRFWDAETAREQSRFAPNIGCIQGLAFSPDGMTIAAAGQKGKIAVWDLE